MTIKLGCHIWTFPQCTVAEAAGIIRALGLAHMDLGNARDFDPMYIAANVADEAARLNRIKSQTGVTFVDAFPHVGVGFSLNHFISHGIPADHISRPDPHATHWHARQACPGQGQSALAQGTIDFAHIVRGLHTRGHAGTICLEYVHGAWLQTDRVDCVSETILLRDELRRWV